MTSVDIFHNKKQSLRRLKATVDGREEGMVGCKSEDTLFSQSAIDIVVRNDSRLFQHLDRVNIVRPDFQLSEHDFAEAALAEHLDENEVLEFDLPHVALAAARTYLWLDRFGFAVRYTRLRLLRKRCDSRHLY